MNKPDIINLLINMHDRINRHKLFSNLVPILSFRKS